jgi:hypothetical protein
MEHLMLFFYVSYSVFKGDLALKMWKSMGRNIAAGFGDDASIQSFGQVSWEVCQYIPYLAHDRFHGMNH